MSQGNLEIKSGKIIRPSIYRGAEEARDYARAASKNLSEDVCVFCPGSEAVAPANVIESIGSSAFRFFVIHATPAYQHFDAHEVVAHRLIVPEEHIESLREIGRLARGELNDYIDDQVDVCPEDFFVQSFTRSWNSPSKSVNHLHTHLMTLSLRPVQTAEYSISRGLTKIEFATPSRDQVRDIIDSRHSLIRSNAE